MHASAQLGQLSTKLACHAFIIANWYNRIEPLLVEHRRQQQSGFTTDAIFALRLLYKSRSEVQREFDRPLYVGYVDLKLAFDSVDLEALWKAVRGVGAPAVLLDLVKDL